MSYSTLMIFKGKQVIDEIEYKNSHGTAPFVWNFLFEKYLKDPNIPYDSWLTRCATGDTALWKLCERKDLPDYERAVHAFTMDRAFVRKENFPKFIAHIMEFLDKGPYKGYPSEKKVCHWRSIARNIQECEGDAVGLYCTSLSDSPWYVQNDDEVAMQLVDITGDDCVDVYKLLAGEYDE